MACTVNLLLLLGNSSNVANSRETSPFIGKPSNSKVLTIRSGGHASWMVPLKAYSFPFSSVWINRHAPCDLCSYLSMLIFRLHGPSHCVSNSRSVKALYNSILG